MWRGSHQVDEIETGDQRAWLFFRAYTQAGTTTPKSVILEKLLLADYSKDQYFLIRRRRRRKVLRRPQNSKIQCTSPTKKKKIYRKCSSGYEILFDFFFSFCENVHVYGQQNIIAISKLISNISIVWILYTTYEYFAMHLEIFTYIYNYVFGQSPKS